MGQGNRSFILITDTSPGVIGKVLATVSKPFKVCSLIILCTNFLYTLIFAVTALLLLNCGSYFAGLKASLERLQLDYVDVVFANRPDPNTPMEGSNSVFSTLFCLFITFLSLVVILCLKKRHSFCLYDDCYVKTRIYKSLVTETSIFKCCLLSWCFHLHTQNEDGCGC